MTKITLPSSAAGTRLKDYLTENGIKISAPCGGRGVCKKCLVKVVSGGFVSAVNGEELSPDENGNIREFEEKPEKPKSRYAVPGLYFYDGDAAKLAHTLQPSARGELEITALKELYLRQGRLHVELMTRGMAWLDTGTPEGMLNAAQYVEAVQSRQGLYIACPEEIAWEQGFISDEEVAARGQELRMTEYGQYLLSLVK